MKTNFTILMNRLSLYVIIFVNFLMLIYFLKLIKVSKALKLQDQEKNV